MLPFLPAPHPIASHPRAIGLVLPSMSGTLAVADRLGYLNWHPYLKVKRAQNVIEDVPTAWIGDILAFLLDSDGPFCSNLNIRGTRDGFVLPQVTVTPKTNLTRAIDKELARQEVEKHLYLEADIQTHQIAGDEIDPIVVANLSSIILWQKRVPPLGSSECEDIVGALRNGLLSGTPALTVLHGISGGNREHLYHAKTVLYQAIWNRELRIDLFQYFFIDHPMLPESRDVLDVYGNWFKRVPK